MSPLGKNYKYEENVSNKNHEVLVQRTWEVQFLGYFTGTNGNEHIISLFWVSQCERDLLVANYDSVKP